MEGPASWQGAGAQVAAIGHRRDSRTAAFRWTGTQWRAIPGPYHDLTIDSTIAVSPSGELWIQSIPLRQGPVVIHHWRSGTCHTTVAPDHLSGLPMEYQSWLSYDGHEGVWSGATAHWTGRRWINAFLVALPPPESASMNAFVAPVPGTTSTWGLGNGSPCQTLICPMDYIAVFGTLP